MKATILQTKVLPSLLAGTSRHPLPAELIHPSDSASDGTLEMLSLLGQALRFTRPSSPDLFTVEPEIRDERTILDAALRRPLIRLLTGKNAADHPARALARSFDRLRLRPHPFDLPLIDGFVRSHAEKLGPTAQHWADRQKPEAETRSYFDAELIDQSNWQQARLSRRVAFLEQRRREDADAARALLESNWPNDEAEARFQLLQTLHTRLSASDQTFLGTLEKDRAPRVRALAAKFLSRLGAGTGNPSLQACLERIKQSQSGLLRKRTVLHLELPANVNEQAASRWILQTFGEVSLNELAGAFHFSENDLLEASAKDDPLLLALALITTNEGRLDLLERVVEHLPNAWQRVFESGLDPRNHDRAGTPPLGRNHRATLPKGSACSLRVVGLAPSCDGCVRSSFCHVHSLEGRFAKEIAGSRTQQPSMAGIACSHLSRAATKRSSRGARRVRTVTIGQRDCPTRYPGWNGEKP